MMIHSKGEALLLLRSLSSGIAVELSAKDRMDGEKGVVMYRKWGGGGAPVPVRFIYPDPPIDMPGH